MQSQSPLLESSGRSGIPGRVSLTSPADRVSPAVALHLPHHPVMSLSWLSQSIQISRYPPFSVIKLTMQGRNEFVGQNYIGRLKIEAG
jgi:hypothetical protein